MIPKKLTIPRHLSPSMREFYKRILNLYDLEEHRLRLLRLACEAFDRGEQARKQITKDGLTFKDRYGGIKPHPAARIESDCKIVFARLLRECQLDLTEPADIRLPRIGE